MGWTMEGQMPWVQHHHTCRTGRICGGLSRQGVYARLQKLVDPLSRTALGVLGNYMQFSIMVVVKQDSKTMKDTSLSEEIRKGKAFAPDRQFYDEVSITTIRVHSRVEL